MRSSSMTRQDLREVEAEFKAYRDEGKTIAVFLVEDPGYRPASPMHFGPAQIINQADFVVYNNVLIKNRFGEDDLPWRGETVPTGMAVARFGVPVGWTNR
jgi:hypothetical protein